MSFPQSHHQLTFAEVITTDVQVLGCKLWTQTGPSVETTGQTNNIHTTPSVDKSSSLVHFIAEWHLKLSAEILLENLRNNSTAVKVKQRVVYFGRRDKLLLTVWRESQRPTGHIPGSPQPWCCVVFLLGSPGQPAPEAGRWTDLWV